MPRIKVLRRLFLPKYSIITKNQGKNSIFCLQKPMLEKQLITVLLVYRSFSESRLRSNIEISPISIKLFQIFRRESL